jgi:hypothetical protein
VCLEYRIKWDGSFRGVGEGPGFVREAGGVRAIVGWRARSLGVVAGVVDVESEGG